MEYKVGIDLSTKETGIVILDSNNNLVFKDTIHLVKWSDSALYNNIATLRKYFDNIKHFFNIKTYVGVELSNFKNPLITTRFSFYAGVICAKLNEFGVRMVKTFNANQWHKLIGVNLGHDTRETTKQLARDWSKQHCDKYQDSWGEDECDAFCIAHLLELIQSTEELHESKKVKRDNHLLYLKKNKAISIMIENRMKKIIALDKIKNAKQIARLEREINELKVQRPANNSTSKRNDC